jgi:hypothetical protein
MGGIIRILIEAFQTTVTRSGSTRKKVTCERCRTDFEYEMSRSVTEAGFASEEVLGRAADAKLRRALAEGCDPHPCPGCGLYQQDMALRVQREATGPVPWWVVGLAVAAGGAFALAAMIDSGQVPPPAGVTAGLVGIGLACLMVLLGFCCRRLYKRFADPNG